MESKKPYKFLKKGSGQLASDYHGVTDYASKRKDKIILEQEKREQEFDLNNNNIFDFVYEKKD